MNLFDVKDRTILITGASRGIGRSMAEAFRDAGAIVYGTGTRPESIEWMKGAGVEGRVVNVTEPGAIDAVIAEITDKHGELKCLVNNAGVMDNTPASSMKEEAMDKLIDINFKGVFRACKAYHKVQRKKGGVIVNVSSVAGFLGSVLVSVYAGTKGAVIQLTRALAIEWAGSNFRVNCICPGVTDTDMSAGVKNNARIHEQAMSIIPMKRMGNPEEMAGAALYLASDASSYMTGQVLVLDGGLSAQ